MIDLFRHLRTGLLVWALLAAMPAGPARAPATPGGVPATNPAGAETGGQAFDFEFGEWTVKLSRRLNPLTGSDTWVDYTGTSGVRKVWNGRANLGELTVSGPAGRIEGLSLRLYDPATGQWRIHWANSRDGHLGAR